MRRAIIIIFISLFYSSAGFSQWTEVAGVYGGSAVDVVASPTGSFYMLLSSGSIFHLPLGETVWQPHSSFPDMGAVIIHLVVSSTNQLYCYANHLYAFDSKDSSWNLISNSLPSDRIIESAVAIGDSTVFAATSRNLYRTYDQGNSWEQIRCYDLLSWFDPSSLLLNTNDDIILLVVDSVHISHDLGEHWDSSENNIDVSSRPGLGRVSCSISDSLIVRNIQDAIALFSFSTGTWREIYSHSIFSTLPSVYASSDGTIWCYDVQIGTYYLFATSDNGNSWDTSKCSNTPLGETRLFHASQTDIYLYKKGYFVFKIPLNSASGIVYMEGVNQAITNVLAIRDKWRYACNTNTTYSNIGNGSNWDIHAGRLFPLRELFITKSGVPVRIDQHVIEWSTDNGENWDNYVSMQNHDADINEANDFIYLAGFSGLSFLQASFDSLLLISPDPIDRVSVNMFGLVVTSTYNGKINAYENHKLIYSSQIPGTHSEILALHVTNDNSVMASTPYSLYMLPDLGSSWVDVTPSSYSSYVKISSDTRGVFYALTSDYEMVYSNDYGATWCSLPYESKMEQIDDFDLDHDTLYVCTIGSGLYSYPLSLIHTDIRQVPTPSEITLSVSPQPLMLGRQSIIQVSIPTTSTVSLHVYDLLGRLVQTVHEGRLAAGSHQMNIHLDKATPGIYFLRMTAGEQQITRKLHVQ